MAAALPYAILAALAVGKLQEASSQSEALKGQAVVSQYNAGVAREQAKSALDVSAANQMRQRREANQVLGRQRAAVAQSGTGFGGSNAQILERSETLAELDALNISYDGMLKSRGYSSQAEIDDFNARAYRSQAKQVKKAGLFGAVGSTGAAAYSMKVL